METDVLIVIVPGLHGRRKYWDQLFDTIDDAARGNDPKGRIKSPEIKEILSKLQGRRMERLFFNYPRHLFSLTGGRDLAIRLNGLIHQKWIENGGFSEIILIGHSFGGLIARQSYLFGLGTDKTVSEQLPWAGKVRRIALLAALNRGLDPHSNFPVWLFSRLVLWFRPFERFMLSNALRGSDFLSNLRIEWIRQFAHHDKDCEVVQVLGDRDSLVKRDDSFDVEKYQLGYILTAPDARHGDIHRLDATQDPGGRLSFLIMVIFGPLKSIAENRDIQKSPEKKKEVIFLLHGIRASTADWPNALEEVIKQRCNNSDAIDIRTPSYGYFSALRFAFPYTRRKNLAWFKDTYTQCFAEYADVDFHFIGHSNGTYLFGHSLNAMPGMRFKRAALVGSVLPSEFDWARLLDREQVEFVRNERARHDVPVGYLCSGLRGLGMKDVGTGGSNGFYQDLPQKAELYWYGGGHSAVFKDDNATKSLAAYILGEIKHDTYLEEPVNRSDQKGPSKVFSILSRTARVQFAVAGLVLMVLAFSKLSALVGWDISSLTDMISNIWSEQDNRTAVYYASAILAFVVGLDNM